MSRIIRGSMTFLNCKICEVPYDEEDHRPRNSPCGHEICSSCIRALIKDGIFECPKCRQKNNANAPEDLPVCFGLIDVIRAFKTPSISLTKKIEPSISRTTNNDLCKVHNKPIEHRCLTCQIWACSECLDFHPIVMGCSTISVTKAVNSIKENQAKSIKAVLNGFKQDVKYASSKLQDCNNKIQELNDVREKTSALAVKQIKEIMDKDEKQRKESLEKVKQHKEEVKKLNNLIEEENPHKEKLLESEKQLGGIHSPYTLMDMIEVLTQRMQFLTSYSFKSLGADSLIPVLKALMEEKYTYVKENGKIYGKLSVHEGNICITHVQKESVPDNCISIPAARFEKMIPEAPLMFVELSLGGSVKGRLYMQLRKGLPIIVKNVVNIITGKSGKSLTGLVLNIKEGDCLRATNLPFSDMKINYYSGRSNAERSDVCVRYDDGSLTQIIFQVKPYDWNSNNFRILGYIVTGMDILQECHDNHSHGVVITNCGLVIEKA